MGNQTRLDCPSTDILIESEYSGYVPDNLVFERSVGVSLWFLSCNWPSWVGEFETMSISLDSDVVAGTLAAAG